MDKEKSLEILVGELSKIKEISKEQCRHTALVLINLYEKMRMEISVVKNKVSERVSKLLEMKEYIVPVNGEYKPGIEMYRLFDPRMQGCCHSCM